MPAKPTSSAKTTLPFTLSKKSKPHLDIYNKSSATKMPVCSRVLLFIICFLLTIKLDYASVLSKETNKKKINIKYLDKIAVELKRNDENLAKEVAESFGLKYNGRIGSLGGFFELEHHPAKFGGIRQRRSLRAKRLLQHPQVKWAEEQVEFKRFKRGYMDKKLSTYCSLMKNKRNSLKEMKQEEQIRNQKRQDSEYFSDPKFEKQWYLNNVGQNGIPAGNDINVVPVYKKGITGKGVVIAVLDDGLDHTHPDLKRNFDRKASINLNERMKDEKKILRPEWDPFPRDTDDYNAHGTKCAGEIAAQANNDICGAGIAPNVKIGGVRMLDGTATDTLEAKALSFKRNYIDIYSNCWGPKDDGRTFGRPGILGRKALEDGAKHGRKGKGSIFVWATGNGGSSEDNCNCDGYTSSIYTISIGAISAYGLSTYFGEMCSSTNGVVFTGDPHRRFLKVNSLVTTNLHHKCAKYFRGTSAAAPLAAGVFALVLQANPNLTWRDLQHLIVKTAKNTSICDPGWRRNAAGNDFNPKFGFGRIDAHAMVTAALNWTNVAQQLKCILSGSSEDSMIPSGDKVMIKEILSDCAITKLEHVQFIVTLKHRCRGDLSIDIKSPQGTENVLLATRHKDNSFSGLKNWAFMTLQLWGENPLGTWLVTVTDNSKTKNRKKNMEQDVEDLERQIIQARNQTLNTMDGFQNKVFYDSVKKGFRRDKIPGLMYNEINRGRTREEYMKTEEIIKDEHDVSQRNKIPFDIYAKGSPIAGYIVKYSFVFWGTKE